MTVTRDDIENAVISYPSTPNGGVTIEGSPLVADFESAIKPREFAREVFTGGSPPYHLWGVHNVLDTDSTGNPTYISVSGLIFHVSEDGEQLAGSSKVNFEIAETFLRVYVDDAADIDHVTKSLTDLCNYYNMDIRRSD